MPIGRAEMLPREMRGTELRDVLRETAQSLGLVYRENRHEKFAADVFDPDYSTVHTMLKPRGVFRRSVGVGINLHHNYNAIWFHPVDKLSARFGVPDKTISKIMKELCDELDIMEVTAAYQNLQSKEEKVQA